MEKIVRLLGGDNRPVLVNPHHVVMIQTAKAGDKDVSVLVMNGVAPDRQSPIIHMTPLECAKALGFAIDDKVSG